MNDSHSRETDTFFEPLQQVEAPASLRTSNRAAIARALKKTESPPLPPSAWWQRRVSVPLPIAAAILLLIGLQLIFQVRALKRPAPSPVPVAHEAPLVPATAEDEDRSFRAPYRQRSVYVAGLGTIYSAEFHQEEM